MLPLDGDPLGLTWKILFPWVPRYPGFYQFALLLLELFFKKRCKVLVKIHNFCTADPWKFTFQITNVKFVSLFTVAIFLEKRAYDNACIVHFNMFWNLERSSNKMPFTYKRWFTEKQACNVVWSYWLLVRNWDNLRCKIFRSVSELPI